MAEMPDNSDESLPESLSADLSAAYRRDVRVPAEVDRLVLARARSEFARRTRMWAMARWAGAGAAAAAVWIVSVVLLRGPEPAVTRTAVAGDADGNGVLDIRDALTLARKLERDPSGGGGGGGA